MLLWLLRWLHGMLCFRIEKGYTEGFLNRLTKSDITVWGIRNRSIGEATTLWTCFRDYPIICRLARQTKTRLRIVKKCGFPILFPFRWGTALGLLLYFVILWQLSIRLWYVPVLRNQEASISEKDIHTAIASWGIREGQLLKSIDTRALSQKLSLRFPTVGWITVYTHGTNLYIDFHEGKKKPDLLPTEIPTNVKAIRDGQIISITSPIGRNQVSVGQTVKKGDLLISGIFENKLGETDFCHACGTVIAKTCRIFTEDIPLTEEAWEYSGRRLEKYRWRFFGMTLFGNLAAIPQNTPVTQYRKSTEEDRKFLFGVPLPILKETELWGEYKKETVIRSPEEAMALAEEKIHSEIAALSQSEHFQLCSRESKQSLENNGCTFRLTAICYCQEDIAVVEEILTDKNNEKSEG